MKELENFINTLRSDGTKNRYKASIESFLKFKNINTMEDFAMVKIQDYYDYKNYLLNEKKNSENTVRPKISAIGSFYNYLILNKIDGITSNVIEESDILKTVKKIVNPEKRTYLKDDEITNFLSECKTLREKAICTVFLNTAIRCSELINLEYDKFTRYKNKRGEDASYIYMTRKGGKIQKLYFNPYVTQVVEEYLKVRVNNCNKLFTSYKGNKLDPVSIHRTIKKIARKANIDKNISAHSLRRTVATDMSKKGVPLRAIQSTLAHNNIATTAIYIQSLNDTEDIMMDYVVQA